MNAPTIGVMLGTHRRPEYFARQLAAIRAQGVRPAEIRVWHDGPEPPPAAEGLTVIAANRNLGVWNRFFACLDFQTEFVCIFDDDTIPGPRWLENCLRTIERAGGPVGAAGCIYADGTRRKNQLVGWRRPMDEALECDVLGHSWFLHREWLGYYAIEPRCPGIVTAGEDYHLSVAMQKHLGLSVWAAPHPPGQLDFWGSIRGNLGNDQHALWRRPGEPGKKQRVHEFYQQGGWQTIFDRGRQPRTVPVPLQAAAAPKPRRPSAPPATLSIIVPTIGRETLARTLASIRAQRLIEGDKVILVQDGPEQEATRRAFEESGLPGKCLGLDRRYADFGATPRNHGMKHARAGYVAFMDDDDVYTPGAFDAIRAAIGRHPGRPMMFRMDRPGWDSTLWRITEVRFGNFSTPMIVVPNQSERLGSWGRHRGSDFAFLCSTVALWPAGSLVWRPEVICEQPQSNGSKPEARPLRRNLVYHVYAHEGNDEWRPNVERLSESWPLFDGRKIVGIVTDAEMVDPETVKRAFPPDDTIEWLVQPNDPEHGETVTFSQAAQLLQSLDPDEATFYAHAKGTSARLQQGPLSDLRSVRRWRDFMYACCLEHPQSIRRHLARYAACGALRINGAFRRATGELPSYWHFAGTFFWFNHVWFFSDPRALTLGTSRFAIERHLGTFLPIGASLCLGPEWPVGRSLYAVSDEEWDAIAKAVKVE